MTIYGLYRHHLIQDYTDQLEFVIGYATSLYLVISYKYIVDRKAFQSNATITRFPNLYFSVVALCIVPVHLCPFEYDTNLLHKLGGLDYDEKHRIQSKYLQHCHFSFFNFWFPVAQIIQKLEGPIGKELTFTPH